MNCIHKWAKAQKVYRVTVHRHFTIRMMCPFYENCNYKYNQQMAYYVRIEMLTVSNGIVQPLALEAVQILI